jgi:L-lactate dehydrogenase complex protein LldG
MPKADILSAIRKNLPESSPLPALEGPWIVYPDPVAQFAEVLTMIGGRCVRVPNRAAADAALAEIPAYAPSKKIVTLVSGVGRGTVELDSVADPHALDDVDFAILPAEFAVAENGAVWVTDAAVKHRAIYFVCEHLAFVVSTRSIVSNLGEAYQRIRFDRAQFGGFIAGPSKTADIEQSLVIGAHGPRSTTIFLIDDL